MARVLIVGCGCRGQMLARALVEQGHAVRGTTRNPARRSEIEAAGAECVVADPDRVGTMIDTLDHVSVTVILLASATGEAEALAALHGPRLDTFATKMVDSTVHGVVYEAKGTVEPALLVAGAGVIRTFGERSRARVAVLEADPGDAHAWLQQALAAVAAALGQS